MIKGIFLKMTDKIFIIFRVPISLCPSNLVDSQHLEEVQGLPTSSWSSRSVTLWCKHQCERWKPQVHSSEAVDALLKSCSVLAGPARLEQASVLPSVILRAFLFIYQLYMVLFFTVPPNFQYQNEKRWAANQRFSSMIFLMYKRSSLVEQRFSF